MKEKKTKPGRLNKTINHVRRWWKMKTRGVLLFFDYARGVRNHM